MSATDEKGAVQETRITVPPPSTPFFSDKMELEESSELYSMYHSDKKQGFVSIDLDPPLQKTIDAPEPSSSLSSPAARQKEEEPTLAAKRIIRSARARSMVIRPEQLPEIPQPPMKESLAYATVRSSRMYMGENVTISSGSVRRLVSQSILVPDDSIFSEEVMARPATISRAKNNNLEISPEKRSVKRSDSTYSVTPQYRASLNDSIFSIPGTLSRKSGTAIKETELVSRQASMKRGTLGKSALKTLTNSATNGVNKSLRGLFEPIAKTTDSQKMELDLHDEHSSTSRQSSNYYIQTSSEHASRYSISTKSIDKGSTESSQKTEAVSMQHSSSFKSHASRDSLEEDEDSVCQTLQTTWDNRVDCFDFDNTGAGSTQHTAARKPGSTLNQQTKKTEHPDDQILYATQHLNRLSSTINGSNKILAGSFDDEPSVFLDHFSLKNGKHEENSKFHSRQSSAGNSTSTAVRLSGGYASSTWNGKPQRNTGSRLSAAYIVDEESDEFDSKKGFFSTMRKDKKTRSAIPFMMPAQIEKDQYLEGGS